MKKQFLHIATFTLCALFMFNLESKAQYWKLTGNAGIDSNNNFVGTTDARPLIFRTKNVERMRIQVGRVAIGLKQPSAKLNIYDDANASLTSPGMLMLGKVGTYNMALDYNVIQARYNGTAAPIYLNYYGGNTYIGPNASLAVDQNGLVTTSQPLGTTGAANSGYSLTVNPGSALNGIYVTDPVNGSVLYSSKTGSNTGVYIAKTSTATSTPCIEGYSSGSGGGVEGYSSTGYGLYGYSTSNYGIVGYSSDSAGVVGLSYNSYAGRFISTNFRGIYVESNPAWFAGYFAGTVYTTGTFTSSDQKLKKNIQDVSKAMDIINQLKPKNYEFRNDGVFAKLNLPQGLHYGLIAQDVEKVLPTLVKEAGTTVQENRPTPKSKSGEGDAGKSNMKSTDVEFKAVNYTELIPIIIKGMQEQQAVIEQQQQQIDALKQLLQNNSSNTSSTDFAKSATPNAALMQNTPNPFNQSTVIRCVVPNAAKKASLLIYSLNGQLVKTYNLVSGSNNVTVTKDVLSAGQYTYTLNIDGKKIDSKNMSIGN